MTSTTDINTALSYYAAHGAALFPIPARQKNPTGIVESFPRDCRTDPNQWSAWYAQHVCNFGLVAGPSRMIVIDVDTKESREAAWQTYCDLCATWGIAPPTPQIQTPSGGWHVMFRVPDGVDSATLRQPDAIKKIINVRAGNGYVVAAGSYYDGTADNKPSGPYVLINDVAPYPAPAALVAHCTRAAPSKSAVDRVGSYKIDDTAKFISWMTEREAFAAYEDWLSAGMALKIEFGDAGLELWRLTFDNTVTDDVERSKWESFSSEPTPGCVTLMSLTQRGKQMGWLGSIGKTTAATFPTNIVADMIAKAGGTPFSAGGAGGAMTGNETLLVELGTPRLDAFLNSTSDAPLRATNTSHPQLPDAAQHHGLYQPMRDCINRMFALAELPKWLPARVTDVMTLLKMMHVDTYNSVRLHLQGMGKRLETRLINGGENDLRAQLTRHFKTEDYARDDKGKVVNDNSDNIRIFLDEVACAIRYNSWIERIEIRGGRASDEDAIHFPEWRALDDTITSRLRTRAMRTGTEFKPGKDFFLDGIIALAHRRENIADPALERLNELATQWDGKPRLLVWLSETCGVECDAYHQAVGLNIIGGMVRRIRNPGCKHDTMPIFCGIQGAGKSLLAAIIADMGVTGLQSIFLASAPWFSDEVELGDDSKELVLSLAGKCIVEIGEMGMKNSATVEKVKAMITRQTDRGRPAYGRFVVDRPRRNIFIGTTNDNQPLTDTTGNRRFLPVRVAGPINLKWLAENIEQLVGEAAHLEAKGRDFTLPVEVLTVAKQHQESARTMTDMEQILCRWFAETDFTRNAYVYKADVSAASQMMNWNRIEQVRANIMRTMGFRDARLNDAARTSIWLRGPDVATKQIPLLPRYTLSKDQVTGNPLFTVRGPNT